jgi:deoxyribodipyrimidine photo-lyase
MTHPTTTAPTVYWLRNDLRLHDNPALCWAAARGPVLAVFILNENDGTRALGGASRWWLHHSLAALQAAGVKIHVARGNPAEVIPQLVQNYQAGAVAWNRAYEPAAQARDAAIKTTLKETGLEVFTANASMLHEPWSIKNLSGTDFKVFTPFWKTCLTHSVPEPLPVPAVEWVQPTGGSWFKRPELVAHHTQLGARVGNHLAPRRSRGLGTL